VLYLWVIIFLVKGDVPIDSDVFLLTDFMNPKIKPTQSFKNVHKNKVYMYIFIEICAIMTYIYTVF
jgi:hypothetical protein